MFLAIAAKISGWVALRSVVSPISVRRFCGTYGAVIQLRFVTRNRYIGK